MFITRLHLTNFISQSPYEVEILILFILHMRELKLRELNLLTENHTDKNRGPKPRFLVPNQIFFPTLCFLIIIFLCDFESFKNKQLSYNSKCLHLCNGLRNKKQTYVSFLN